MAYNAIAQHEHEPEPDALSDSTDSPLISPGEHHDLIFQHLSTDLVPLSPLSDGRDLNESRRGSISLQHPMPDLQSLQGAYLANVERLEQSAERLSMSSDIGEELRKLKLEQRMSESRRSSVPGTHAQDGERSLSVHRQFSYEYGSHASNSIIGTNNVARSGGFSPAAYFASPRSSIRSDTWSRSSVKGRATSHGSRLAQLQGAEQDTKGYDSMTSAGLMSIPPPPETFPKVLRVVNNERDADGVEVPRPFDVSPRKLHDVMERPHERPTTATSTGTSLQADGLFHDFDGIHAMPHLEGNMNKIEDAKRRTVSDRPQSVLEPVPGENMVYYPAPVPMMLNLPQRLSKLPSAPQREKRRADVLSGLAPGARNSAPWLANVLEGEDEESRFAGDQLDVQSENGRNRRTMATLPPQLRASMFFDYPPTGQDVQVKGESAVATLDSILDASAFAPVTAFTDHPIVGHIGAEVYGKSGSRTNLNNNDTTETAHVRKKRLSSNRLQKRHSASNLLEDTGGRESSFLSLGVPVRRRKSSGRALSDSIALDEAEAASLHNEETPLQTFHREDPRQGDIDAALEEADFDDAQELFSESEPGDNEEPKNYNEHPTTLLAELQLRKVQQKQRNRTAATAFPDGMHSTLLELDAVADVQRQSRKQKHVTLAWEDPSVRDSGIDPGDDEDVPLGMLFPGHQTNGRDRRSRLSNSRPLGLIARRELEDNEPLSHRRARLRGEDIVPQTLNIDHRASMYTLDTPDLAKNAVDAPEIENESLAQRAERLRQRHPPSQLPRPVSGDFASEVMSQFGGLSADMTPRVDEPPSETPDFEEETLGQRRKRLQAERDARPRDVSGDGGAVAARPPLSNRRSMADLLQAHPVAGPRGPPTNPQTQWAIMQQQASSNYLAMASGMVPAANPGLNGYIPHPLVYNHPLMNTAGHAPHRGTTGLQVGQSPIELDPRRRDTINRWRQSVTYS
jgi:hypothetical protein